MFQITRFVMEDFVDSLNQTIYIVSLNKRYMVYNSSRRRLVLDTVQHMGVDQAPLDLITVENLCAWTRTSRYRVRGEDTFAPSYITYRVAVVESRDRYDVHQMMRRLLTPAMLADLPRLARGLLSSRVDAVVEAYAKKHDPNANHAPPVPCAKFKGSWYYEHSKDYFKIARKHYLDFGHLVARAKAGDESITNDELRSAFFVLAGRYSDAESHITNAFEAIEVMGDMNITHCDCGNY